MAVHSRAIQWSNQYAEYAWLGECGCVTWSRRYARALAFVVYRRHRAAAWIYDTGGLGAGFGVLSPPRRFWEPYCIWG
jgi:hypothetical protein